MQRDFKVKNLIFSILMCFVLVLGCFYALFPFNKAFAENTSINGPYESSSIEEDLSAMEISTDYSSDTVKLLYFLEYGYEYEEIYSIYVYTYIPFNVDSISEIIYTSKNNTLTFGFTDNKDDVLRVDYNKLPLRTKTGEEDKWFLYNEYGTGVFVKWKIDLTGNNFIGVGCTDRYYCVSGIELQEKRNSTATEFLVGNVYHCYSDGVNDCVDRESLDTVSVDTFHTFFRTGVSLKDQSLDSGWQNQISSCYFSLPKFIGNVDSSNLSFIKAMFEYYYTKPILILGNDTGSSSRNVYDAFSRYVGKNISYYEENLYFYSRYYQNFYNIGGSHGVYVTEYNFDMIYNEDKILDFLGKSSFDGEGETGYTAWHTKFYYLFNELWWLFYDEDLNNHIENGVVSEDYVFDGDRLYNYYENSGFTEYALFENKEITESLTLLNLNWWENELTYGNKESNSVDITKLTFANLSLNTNGTFWQKLGASLKTFWKALFNERAYEETEVCPMEKVDYNDVYALTNDEFSKKYFVDVNEVNSFKTYCKENQILNKDVWILRYDVSEYYSYTANCHYTVGENSYNAIGLVAIEPVYLNFDILQFGFSQDGKEYIIPAIHSPENVFHDLTVQKDISDELFNSFKLIVGLLLGLVLLIILWPFISPFVTLLIKLVIKGFGTIIKIILKGITFVLSLPFKLFSLIFGKRK